MPVATTPMKVAIRRALSTLRRIIISGSDRAITLIMKASTVPSAAPFAEQRLHDRDHAGALVYIGTPISTASGTDHQARWPMKTGHEFLRHIAVDDGADGNADENVGPDLADDLRTLATGTDAFG